MIEIRHSVPFVLEDEGHGVPRQIDRSLARARLPVPSFTGFADPVGTHEDRLVARFRKHLVVGPEMHAGVLRVAVQPDRTGARPQPRCKLDEMTARNVVHGQLALFVDEDLLFLSMPTDGESMSAQHDAGLAHQETVMRFIRAVDAMPGVGSFAVAVTNTIEAEEDTAMMRRMDLGIVRQSAGRQHVALG